VDVAEHGGQAIPLRCEAVEALGVGQRVCEGSGAVPEGEVAKGGTAFEELD